MTMEKTSMLDKFRLDGQTAVVTGAGKGIGRGIALALAECGANVAVAARRADDINAVRDEIEARGVKGLAVPTDVLDFPAIDKLAEAAETELGALSIWVNNAGGNLDRQTHALAETTEDNWDTLIDLNLKTLWWGSKTAAARFKNGGRIINIASTAALGPSPGFGPYGAARAGVMQMTKTLAVELAPLGITVNCVAPGVVVTEMLLETMHTDEAGVNATMAAAVPLGRLGTPEDIATAAVYFAAPATEWVTGQTLVVSGGQ
jgi:7-alpha-hydroxysteroid dehydrogenase